MSLHASARFNPDARSKNITLNPSARRNSYSVFSDEIAVDLAGHHDMSGLDSTQYDACFGNEYTSLNFDGSLDFTPDFEITFATDITNDNCGRT
jgi:hypothetical protein